MFGKGRLIRSQKFSGYIVDLNAGMILEEFTSFYDQWLCYIELWKYRFGCTDILPLSTTVHLYGAKWKHRL
jgi:hypothetical protein